MYQIYRSISNTNHMHNIYYYTFMKELKSLKYFGCYATDTNYNVTYNFINLAEEAQEGETLQLFCQQLMYVIVQKYTSIH